MVELGVLFATGSGVPKDEAQARKLFERAAQGGNPRGVANLAALPNAGAAPSDPAKARAFAGESGGDQFGGSAVSARLDDCRWCRRPGGRCGRADVV